MIRGVKLSNSNFNILLGISTITQVILKGVNTIPSSSIKDKSIKQIGVAVTLSEPSYSRF